MVILADVWKNTSIVVFFILAGLQTISSDLYESARMDGAGAWAAFWRITLPLLAPSIAVVLILRTIEAFKVFDIIYVMTGGGPASGTQTVAFYTYLQAFSNQLFGYGAALAYLIVLAVFALAMVYLRVLRQGADGRCPVRHSRTLPGRDPRGGGRHGDRDPAALRVAAHLQHLPAH